MAAVEEGLQVSLERDFLVVRPCSCPRGVRTQQHVNSQLTYPEICFVFERQEVDGRYAEFMMFMMFLGGEKCGREGDEGR